MLKVDEGPLDGLGLWPMMAKASGVIGLLGFHVQEISSTFYSLVALYHDQTVIIMNSSLHCCVDLRELC